MTADEHRAEDGGGRSRTVAFATTHWSAVLTAAHDSSPDSRQALEQLCRTYWYPLYAFVRRQGHSPDDAQDLVQGFFFHLLNKGILHTAEPARGKFRSFLLGTLKHFLSAEAGKAHALKRGGEQEFVSWDLVTAEGRFQQEPAEESTPERLFERQWALTILAQALERLRTECSGDGRSELFERLKDFVTGEKGSLAYSDAACGLSLSKSAVKSAIFRLRQRYHQMVREEVGHTVADPNDIEGELRYMASIFSQSS